MHARIGAAPSNFPNRLAPADSDLAQQSTRDPVLLDFLGLARPVHEHAVEAAMMDDLTRTMRCGNPITPCSTSWWWAPTASPHGHG